MTRKKTKKKSKRKANKRRRAMRGGLLSRLAKAFRVRQLTTVKGEVQRAVPLWSRTARVLRRWLDELDTGPQATVFPNARGQPLTRHGVAFLIRKATDSARITCPSLTDKRVSSHTIRHTTAMHLLQSGVDLAVIALWLGHESIETTHVYVEADLAMKKKALDKLSPAGRPARRFKPNDELMSFLAAL